MTAGLGALVRLGGGSALAIAGALSLGKAQAVILGPEGVARFSLLQTVVALTLIPASFGMGQALTRLVSADAHGAVPDFDGARRAACLIRGITGAVCILLLAIAAAPICSRLLGGRVAIWEFDLTLAVIGCSLIVGHNMSVLAAAHRIKPLARFTVMNALVGTAAAIATIVVFGHQGVAPSLLVGGVVAALLSRRAVRTAVPVGTASARGDRVARSSLLHVGAPYTAAMLVGTAVNAAIPLVALQLLGTRGVAYYQVSTAVATGYLGFLGVAIAQDYFPRITAASRNQLSEVINAQHRLVLTISLPLVLVTVAVAPLVLRFAFSREFEAASGILRWQALADVFRFSSWTLSYALLARLPMRWFLGTEAFGGAMIIVAVLISVHLWGQVGLGIAWLATYASYYAVVALIVTFRMGFRYSAANRCLLSLAVASMGISAVVMASGSMAMIAGAIGTLAAAWAAYCAWTVLTEFRPMRLRRKSEAVPASMV